MLSGSYKGVKVFKPLVNPDIKYAKIYIGKTPIITHKNNVKISDGFFSHIFDSIENNKIVYSGRIYSHDYNTSLKLKLTENKISYISPEYEHLDKLIKNVRIDIILTDKGYKRLKKIL
jgi:hypothetical protein